MSFVIIITKRMRTNAIVSQYHTKMEDIIIPFFGQPVFLGNVTPFLQDNQLFQKL